MSDLKRATRRAREKTLPQDTHNAPCQITRNSSNLSPLKPRLPSHLGLIIGQVTAGLVRLHEGTPPALGCIRQYLGNLDIWQHCVVVCLWVFRLRVLSRLLDLRGCLCLLTLLRHLAAHCVHLVFACWEQGRGSSNMQPLSADVRGKEESGVKSIQKENKKWEHTGLQKLGILGSHTGTARAAHSLLW